MNRETFLESFGHIANAPGGIDKLRIMILNLAMRGRLTGQQVADEPATAVLHRARKAKAALIADGRIRKPKAYGPVEPGDEPYPLPPGWAWCRTVDLLHTVNGRAFKPTEWSSSGLPIIRIQNLNNAAAPFNYFSGLVDEQHLVHPGDLLISWSGTPGTSFGSFVWDGPAGVLNQHIFKCSLFEDYRDFICLAINSRLDVLIEDAHGGVGLQHFTKDKLERLPLAIPPLQEQQRIVQRVSDLMDLCDELGQQQEAGAEARSALTASTLKRTTEAGSVDLRTAIHAFTDNIGLHLVPGDGDLAALNRLRQTILSLAVRGRLTSGDPSDEPVEELLRRAALDRQRLVSERKIRGSALVPQAYLGGKDGPIPLRWARVRLGGLGAWGSGATPSRSNGAYYGGAIPWLKSGELNDGYVATSEETITELALRETSVRLRQRGDVLIAMYGATTGRTAILDMEATTNQAVCACQPYEGVDNRFLHLLLMAMRPQFVAQGAGGAQPNISKEKIEGQVVALPPQAEQVRIVERVHELMTICDDLERQLLAARLLRRDLSASIAAHAASEPSASATPAPRLSLGLARPNDAVRSSSDATQLGDLRGKTAIESSALRARPANPAAD